MGTGGIPYLATHDGRTFRYPHPDIQVNDTVKVDLHANKITDFIKFDVGMVFPSREYLLILCTGNLVMVTGGHNLGRVGLIISREKHPGSFEIIHIKDAVGHEFSTRMTNVFVIGKGNKCLVTLPRGKGVRKSILQEAADRDKKLNKKAAPVAPVAAAK